MEERQAESPRDVNASATATLSTHNSEEAPPLLSSKATNSSSIKSKSSNTSSKASATTWSLQIRSVSHSQADFCVQVDPHRDTLQQLYHQILHKTGHDAVRLIYRGRLLSLQNTQQQQTLIADIPGLSDGHCIHLIPKPAVPSPTSAEDANSVTTATETSRSSSSSPSLLRTILGLEGSDTTTNNNNNNNTDSNNANSTPTTTRRRRPYARRYRPYRLTADDLQVPDPGSLEPVRQGLLTLHTMLPNSINNTHHPLAAQRQWYRGQWIDCKDTVNQWLEATIVDIKTPDEVLPPRNDIAAIHCLPHPPTTPATDPPVHADDWQGRIRLLLEPCPAGCPDQDEGGAWAGMRRRASNAHVVLLLVHYNGWPHRWDEWIRSDSERLRPFRVRTRHGNATVAPTVQAPFADQPSTRIGGGTEAEDRRLVLPEVLRVMQQVQDVLAQAVGPNVVSAEEPAHPGATTAGQLVLPWRRRVASTSTRADNDDNDDDDDDEEEETSTIDGSTTMDGSVHATVESIPPPSSSTTNQPMVTTRPSREQQRALQSLAPLLDRLGRTMVDLAPHVASLAAAENEPTEETALDTIQEHPGSLGGLLSMLSRDRRRNSMASSQAVASLSTADPTTSVDQATVTTANSEISIDPDYTDFATGVVNTVRGEVRTGPRARSLSGSDDLSSLLGAYIAAATLAEGASGEDSNLAMLGRLLRDRDSGGGIDIHIHAVVTAPGGMVMDPPAATAGNVPTTTTTTGGGLGALLASLGSPTTATTTNPVSPARANNNNTYDDSLADLARTAPDEDEPTLDDEMGIFSELYGSPAEPAVTPSPPRRRYGSSAQSHQSPNDDSSSNDNDNNTSSPRRPTSPPRATRARGSHGTNNSSTPSPNPRRQGFLGRFLRRNQGSD